MSGTKQPDATAANLDKLRAKFDRASIGLLPKLTCKDCQDKKVDCKRHQKSKCNDCGNYISTAHIHLDYVGHAAVTDRLLSVDPNWTWAPMAVTESGVPVGDSVGNLWINLTVLGITRPGVGDGSNMKERIGDAIRNAAMRFGVALDLWTKEELESVLDDPSKKNEKPSDKIRSAADVAADADEVALMAELGDQLFDLLKTRYPAKKIRLTVESLRTSEERQKAIETLTRKVVQQDEDTPIDLDATPAEINTAMDAIDVDAEAQKQTAEDDDADLLREAKHEVFRQFASVGITNPVQQKAFLHKVMSKTTIDSVEEADLIGAAIKTEAEKNRKAADHA